ncbi:MAG: hypothetical protein KME06_05835 [Kastovskya adunca ATA6-11-RM4]|nr:hypothetical protein [Kastovskya adunca ATA6-11-RM4]
MCFALQDVAANTSKNRCIGLAIACYLAANKAIEVVIFYYLTQIIGTLGLS